MDAPSVAQIAQFSGLDPRTSGKLLKNAAQIGLVDKVGQGHVLLVSYPYKGDDKQKRDVVREALLKMPLLISIRQFMKLGDDVDAATRKAATISNIVPFSAADLSPLLEWARNLNVLDSNALAEDMVEYAEATKQVRHEVDRKSRVAFLSHSSHDKSFIRQLASDLTQNGIKVWLDEQRIKVGESIPEKISQGLAESDHFLIAVSKNSVDSDWVKKELNSALVNEVQRRAVHILPLKLDGAQMPAAIHDKKYADFSSSYKAGLNELLVALREDVDE
jgi:uncharacterized membrane protein